MILFLIRRLQTTRLAEKIILATTELPADDKLVSIAEAEEIPVFRGAENDVVKRFVDAASHFEMEYVVRITGDCPFVDGESLDFCLQQCNQLESFDLASTKGQFPVGIDYEIYSAKTMAILNEEKLTVDEREHLTLPIYNRPERFDIHSLRPPESWPKVPLSFTVDTEDDYHLAQNLAASQDTIYFDIPTLLKKALQIYSSGRVQKG